MYKFEKHQKKPNRLIFKMKFFSPCNLKLSVENIFHTLRQWILIEARNKDNTLPINAKLHSISMGASFE